MICNDILQDVLEALKTVVPAVWTSGAFATASKALQNQDAERGFNGGDVSPTDSGTSLFPSTSTDDSRNDIDNNSNSNFRYDDSENDPDDSDNEEDDI